MELIEECNQQQFHKKLKEHIQSDVRLYSNQCIFSKLEHIQPFELLHNQYILSQKEFIQILFLL